jgi:hypothetical protein
MMTFVLPAIAGYALWNKKEPGHSLHPVQLLLLKEWRYIPTPSKYVMPGNI